MRTGIKILISLFASLAVFLALFVFSITGYGSFIEANFYQPAVVRSLKENLNKVAASAAEWHRANEKSFAEFLQNDFVKRAALQEQSEADIKIRDDSAYSLISNVTGLTGLRIIDADTLKIHYSTFSDDIILRSEQLISYRRYEKEREDIPLKFVSVPKGGKAKITVDSVNGLFLYCFPFYDNYQAYRGTAVFYVASKSFLRRLIANKTLTLSNDLNLVADKNYTSVGILTGLSDMFSEELRGAVGVSWEENSDEIRLLSLKNSQNWVLVSIKTDFGHVGQVCEKDLFIFSPIIKYFLMFTAFITAFLIVFLILNMRQDRFFVAQNKIQQLHLGILKNYIKDAQSKNWESLQKELEYRRHEVNAEIKKGMGKKTLAKKEKQIDAILQKSWEDIFAAINGKYSAAYANINTAEADTAALVALLRQILAETGTKPLVPADGSAASADSSGIPSPAAPVSDAPSEIGEAEPVEEIEPADLGGLEEAVLEEEAFEKETAVTAAKKQESDDEAELIEEIELADLGGLEEEIFEQEAAARKKEQPAKEIEAIALFDEADEFELLEAEQDVPEDGAQPAKIEEAEAVEELGEIEELDEIEEAEPIAETEDAEPPSAVEPAPMEASKHSAARHGGLMRLAQAKVAKLNAAGTEPETVHNAEDGKQAEDGFMQAAESDKPEPPSAPAEAASKKRPNPIDDLDDLINAAEEIPEIEPLEPLEDISDTDKAAGADGFESSSEFDEEPAPFISGERKAFEISEFDSNEELEALNNLYLDNLHLDELGDLADEDPLKIFDEMGFTVSGIDFSDLETPENYADKAGTFEIPDEVTYIENTESGFPMWGKYSEDELQGDLEVCDEAEEAADDGADEDIIISGEDGTFTIRKTADLKPENEEFKALVDSVLK